MTSFNCRKQSLFGAACAEEYGSFNINIAVDKGNSHVDGLTGNSCNLQFVIAAESSGLVIEQAGYCQLFRMPVIISKESFFLQAFFVKSEILSNRTVCL